MDVTPLPFNERDLQGRGLKADVDGAKSFLLCLAQRLLRGVDPLQEIRLGDTSHYLAPFHAIADTYVESHDLPPVALCAESYHSARAHNDSHSRHSGCDAPLPRPKRGAANDDQDRRQRHPRL